MKERRSLYSLLFGKEKTTEIPREASEFKILNSYNAYFSNYDGKYYDEADVRACVDAIARNAAKLYPKHIRTGKNGLEKVNDNLQRILSKKPNELQNAYQFYYHIISELELFNNAFVYIMKNENFQIVGLYPLHYQQIKLYEYQKEIWINFSFVGGKTRFVPLKNCIHLTRFVSNDGVMGGNNDPIIKTLSLKHILDEGIINAIKTTHSIRGVIKTTQSLLSPKDVKSFRDQFVKDFIGQSDGTGIAGLDAKSEFTPIKLEPTTATDEQNKLIDKKVKDYYGISDHIVQSNYSEEEWNAFYESIIEPLGIQMGLEFTNKLFTETEKYHGNEIVFTSNRLQYASNNTKINLLRYANNLMMIDELREVFNLEPLPDGKGQVIMQDLNHIDSDIANSYQLDEKGGKEDE